jgi:hypothetical protein
MSRVKADNGHVYPSRYEPLTGSAAMDEAWEMLDKIEPGVIPPDTRFLLAGMIAGTIMRYQEAAKRK